MSESSINSLEKLYVRRCYCGNASNNLHKFCYFLHNPLLQMFLFQVRVIIVKLAERGNLEILFEEMKFISTQEAGKVMLLEKKIKKLKTIIFISCTLFVVFVVRIMK
ncbi:hypothetical protein R3W88_000528 [Solanum pinnatisectum]|uniref:Uncharacterized protein n=1 Tax=Solanum pinnatisectum TaxID=50273 RepID=A0AAV9MG57_9SOLN|nr:hypothetical protein R3W88_000528 [Solanum pinnatisectum]